MDKSGTALRIGGGLCKQKKFVWRLSKPTRSFSKGSALGKFSAFENYAPVFENELAFHPDSRRLKTE
jgi:hypothetical protein